VTTSMRTITTQIRTIDGLSIRFAESEHDEQGCAHDVHALRGSAMTAPAEDKQFGSSMSMKERKHDHQKDRD
jgi:hypothetical protein